MKHLISRAGYVFARKDKTAVYGHNMYLSDLDSPINYIELSEEEGKALQKELDEAVLEKAGR